ncbi:hypothetical protein BJ875DRAFT_514713 [Amylocarpus encephaloides]|uniref:Uncharacterized protein n=1 Tax=Amylocarpus encephaloides TaxID=45428 RepID=A0A9P8CAI1_9HELO|nr:hypothetical protein BJ875DRAFT_514713 [Amylocarpus encephaloides]
MSCPRAAQIPDVGRFDGFDGFDSFEGWGNGSVNTHGADVYYILPSLIEDSVEVIGLHLLRISISTPPPPRPPPCRSTKAKRSCRGRVGRRQAETTVRDRETTVRDRETARLRDCETGSLGAWETRRLGDWTRSGTTPNRPSTTVHLQPRYLHSASPKGKVTRAHDVLSVHSASAHPPQLRPTATPVDNVQVSPAGTVMPHCEWRHGLERFSLLLISATVPSHRTSGLRGIRGTRQNWHSSEPDSSELQSSELPYYGGRRISLSLASDRHCLQTKQL